MDQGDGAALANHGQRQAHPGGEIGAVAAGPGTPLHIGGGAGANRGNIGPGGLQIGRVRHHVVEGSRYQARRRPGRVADHEVGAPLEAVGLGVVRAQAHEGGVELDSGDRVAGPGGDGPAGLAVTHGQVREGRGLDFAACMRLAYRLVTRFIEGHDFYEGIRAALIDKDRAPLWRPGSLEEVPAAAVDRYFASLGRREMRL